MACGLYSLGWRHWPLVPLSLDSTSNAIRDSGGSHWSLPEERTGAVMYVGYKCAALSLVLLELKDPLELFVKRSEFLPGSRFPSCRDMT